MKMHPAFIVAMVLGGLIWAVALAILLTLIDQDVAAEDITLSPIHVPAPEAAARLWCLEPGPIRESCARQGCTCTDLYQET